MYSYCIQYLLSILCLLFWQESLLHMFRSICCVRSTRHCLLQTSFASRSAVVSAIERAAILRRQLHKAASLWRLASNALTSFVKRALKSTTRVLHRHRRRLQVPVLLQVPQARAGLDAATAGTTRITAKSPAQKRWLQQTSVRTQVFKLAALASSRRPISTRSLTVPRDTSRRNGASLLKTPPAIIKSTKQNSQIWVFVYTVQQNTVSFLGIFNNLKFSSKMEICNFPIREIDCFTWFCFNISTGFTSYLELLLSFLLIQSYRHMWFMT